MQNIILLVLSVCYPFLMYYGLQHWEPKYLTVVFLLLFLLRLKSPSSIRYEKVILGIILSIVMAYTCLSNHALGVRLYPVLINFMMLVVFSYSLVNPPSMIERFARMTEPALPAKAVVYTRIVTKVWVAFFSMNLCLALFTAIFCSDKIWALYNGFIAYILMGLLFFIEYLVRMRVRKNHE